MKTSSQKTVMFAQTATQVTKKLKKLGTPKRAKASARYFKTGKGQYGYGDVFLGLNAVDQRKIAKEFSDLPIPEIKKLLLNKYHECRLTGLLILVLQYKKADGRQRNKIAKFYLSNTKRVNNWDLVDLSAPNILGNYLLNKNRAVLYKLAKSENLWEKRIAILATFAFIKEDDFKESLKIAEILINDKHDLIHKAIGWMLREIGKRSLATEEKFLQEHVLRIPRTTLRYAIERFPENKRQRYLKAK